MQIDTNSSGPDTGTAGGAADGHTGPLPAPLARARLAGEPWAIRLACVWDTIERYEAVRRRHDRLPAHHLVCALADDVRGLAVGDVLDSGARWRSLAERFDTTCNDPLGDDPLDAVDELTATIVHLAERSAADTAA